MFHWNTALESNGFKAFLFAILTDFTHRTWEPYLQTKSIEHACHYVDQIEFFCTNIFEIHTFIQLRKKKTCILLSLKIV